MEKLSTVAEWRKVTFLGCIHGRIWALDTHEETWAKKVGSLKKFDWTHVNKPLVKELICSFSYDNQYVKLEDDKLT